MQTDPPPDTRHRLPLWVAVALCVGTLGAGAMVLPMLRLDPVPRVQQAPDIAPPEGGAATPVARAAPAHDPRAPRFDLVRTDADGRVLVAGQAPPGAQVGLVVDGVTQAETTADGTGQFVAFLTLDRVAGAQVLWLVTRDGAGGVVTSADTVILAPDTSAPDSRAPVAAAPAGGDTPRPSVDTATAAAPARPPDADVGPEIPRGPRTAETLAAAPADPVVAEADPPPDPDPVTLFSDADGVRVMETAPLPGAAVRLDSVDYGAEGAVVLRGRAEPGGVVRVTLSALPPVEVVPDADGTWTLRLPDVPPGDYRLDIARAAEPGAPATDTVSLPFRRAAPEDVAAALSGEAARIVTVQPGATLWAIARDRYGDGARFVQVYDANRDAIRDPDLIYPGQVFRLPDPAAEGASGAAPR
jgi:nucleoid-associated protein YgaU